MFTHFEKLRSFLDAKAATYEHPDFIADDPVSIPHMFTLPADIEIAGFFAAILAWGRRTTIINSCHRLLTAMDNAPHQFIVQHTDADLKPLLNFVHRTCNATDILYFIYWLRHHYTHHQSLEQAFVPGEVYSHTDTEQALVNFHNNIFSLSHPDRTRKHIATPQRKAACKRLNMYLRWMVRSNEAGVDFGLWKKISPAQLVCPLDVHVARVAHRLNLIPNGNANWENAVFLTGKLRQMDPRDPIKYDFALFSLGINERF